MPVRFPATGPTVGRRSRAAFLAGSAEEGAEKDMLSALLQQRLASRQGSAIIIASRLTPDDLRVRGRTVERFRFSPYLRKKPW